jgi:hypothetical protein
VKVVTRNGLPDRGQTATSPTSRRRAATQSRRPPANAAPTKVDAVWVVWASLCRVAAERLPAREHGQNSRGFSGDFCANWLRFSKKVPSKSLIA